MRTVSNHHVSARINRAAANQLASFGHLIDGAVELRGDDGAGRWRLSGLRPVRRGRSVHVPVLVERNHQDIAFGARAAHGLGHRAHVGRMRQHERHGRPGTVTRVPAMSPTPAFAAWARNSAVTSGRWKSSDAQRNESSPTRCPFTVMTPALVASSRLRPAPAG